MKLKKLPFYELSDRKCPCGKKIKANVSDRKAPGKLLLCNKCHANFEAGRGHFLGKHGNPRKKRIAAGLPVKSK